MFTIFFCVNLINRNILMKEAKILWADDEIDLLKPHILFLQGKGYEVVAVNNGDAAIDQARAQYFDIIFLDEQMPGISGIDALSEIKSFKPDIPVILITKSEEENIMEAAIGAKISDYLIKPVNPNQILLTLKKNLKHKELISQNTTSKYQAEFSKLGIEIMNADSHDAWIDVYRKIVYWELELEVSGGDVNLNEILQMQKREANNSFARFVKKNYLQWFSESTIDRPLLSQSVVKQKLIPHIKESKQTCFIVIDNLRYDQWVSLRPELQDFFNITDDSLYYSILPTVTQYARNSLFAGLMPLAIENIYPNLWLNDEDEGLKNKYEEDLFTSQLKRLGINEKVFFEKVTAISAGKKLPDKIQQILSHKISVIVYNFVDNLSHARTEMDMIKELAADEKAYRSLTLSWFKHSPLLEVMKELSAKGVRVVLTTDHGSIKVTDPVKVVGDKNITSNLRYKQGKTLQYNPKEVFEIKNPKLAQLPACHLSSTYVFTMGNDFFAYPNNYNHYVKYYKDTLQHGGVSLEEMIIPIVTLEPKNN